MSSASRYFQAIWFPSRLRLSKLRPPSDLVDQVHVSGALSGACTGKGPEWQTHAQRRNLGTSVRRPR